MSVDELGDLVEFVRGTSPFYAELYRDVPKAQSRIDALPVVDQSSFWAANTLADNRVLTGSLDGGVVFKSGGTTGQPKFSVFTPAEWATFTEVFGRGMASGGLRAGDRVANLFYVGELYASFLFIMDSMWRAPVDVMQFPIGGTAPWEGSARTIADFDVNVVAAVPTTVLSFASWLIDRGQVLEGVDRILFGGEALYPDQLPTLQSAFPRASVQSIGYASVDAGLLGYAGSGCGPGEHRPFSPETILEIVEPETHEVIREVGRPGKVLLTNLTRRLMPIIRYPAGDVAQWVEYPQRFRILGRSEEGARVGPATLYLDDLRRIVFAADTETQIANVQVVIRHHGGRDQLVLRLVRPAGGDDDPLALAIIERLHNERSMLGKLTEDGTIHPSCVEWIDASQLAVNPRTGKLVRLVDERLA